MDRVFGWIKSHPLPAAGLAGALVLAYWYWTHHSSGGTQVPTPTGGATDQTQPMQPQYPTGSGGGGGGGSDALTAALQALEASIAAQSGQAPPSTTNNYYSTTTNSPAPSSPTTPPATTPSGGTTPPASITTTPNTPRQQQTAAPTSGGSTGPTPVAGETGGVPLNQGATVGPPSASYRALTSWTTALKALSGGQTLYYQSGGNYEPLQTVQAARTLPKGTQIFVKTG